MFVIKKHSLEEYLIYDGGVAWGDKAAATRFASFSDFYVWYQAHAAEVSGVKCDLVGG